MHWGQHPGSSQAAATAASGDGLHGTHGLGMGYPERSLGMHA